MMIIQSIVNKNINYKYVGLEIFIYINEKNIKIKSYGNVYDVNESIIMMKYVLITFLIIPEHAVLIAELSVNYFFHPRESGSMNMDFPIDTFSRKISPNYNEMKV